MHRDWDLDAMREWEMKSVLQEQSRERAEGMRGCSAAELCGLGWGLAPYDPATGGMCQRLPLIAQERLHFTRLIQGRTCHPHPQPGPIQPSGPAWFLLQAGECHGNASAGMLTHRHTLAHTYASSLLLPVLPCMLFLLSVLLSCSSRAKDLEKAPESSVL